MEDIHQSVQLVWARLKFSIRWSTMKIKDEEVLSRHDEEILRLLEVPFQHRSSKMPIIVHWRPPDAGRVKLNINVSCNGNPSVMGRGVQISRSSDPADLADPNRPKMPEPFLCSSEAGMAVPVFHFIGHYPLPVSK
ncbi:hypothetical protein CIPAW_15G081200 [Carya illinoinensis]|uniref:Uncharacterized protein n=1 Tax=Carya illinoinensis TaxID=32201 RepID=A0A8T1N972_CARIL|nr:hypothetical protein CIPAW_15G081200 [Carya illinoinensis]